MLPRTIAQVLPCEVKPCARFSSGPANSYLVRFPDGLFLRSYHQSEGVILTAQRDLARIWRNRNCAEGVAQLLRGEVIEIRPQTNPPFQPTATQVECCRILVEIAGGQFAGIFPGIQGRSEPLVLFNSPRTKTTLGILLPELSAELVRLKLVASDAAFGAVQP
jgi:hypothetical protein